MSLLLDTNVILDVWLQREPHVEDSARVMALVEEGEVRASLCATTLTTLFYLGQRVLGADGARRQIEALLRLFSVAPVNRAVLSEALGSRFADFEDAVLHEAARHAGCQAIITRNTADFASASLRIHTPTQYLQMHRMSLHEKAARYRSEG
ncbi:MAG: PIN domain-containing protein [Lautropia sp.]|nr:PIN domain-containing protein [Lautropia sp.]